MLVLGMVDFDSGAHSTRQKSDISNHYHYSIKIYQIKTGTNTREEVVEDTL